MTLAAPDASNETVIQTMYHHSHNADGTARADHCCGCWNIVANTEGICFRCNECGEEIDLTGMIDPDKSAILWTPL